MRTRLLALALLLGLGSFAAPSAQAADLVLSPPKFEEEVLPGETIEKLVKVTNRAGEDIVVEAEVQDFLAAGEGGEPSFTPQGNAAQSLRDWVSFPQSSVIIPAGKTVRIPFTIRVPADAEPGGHYGSVFFVPPPTLADQGETRVQIIQKLGSLVLLRVRGDVHEEAKLLSFDTFSPVKPDSPGAGTGVVLAGGDLHEASPQHVFTSLPVALGARLENLGSVHVKPEGRIEIYNMFGQLVKRTAIRDILNAQGLKMGEEVTDFVPLNNELGNVLPASVRGFASTWRGTASYHFDETTGNKNLEMGGFQIGRYRAVLHLKYGASGTELEPVSVAFWVLPILHILGGIVVLAGLIGFTLWRRRSSAARLEALVAARLAEKDSSAR